MAAESFDPYDPSPDYDRRMDVNRIVTSNALINAEDADLLLVAALLRTDPDSAADKLNGTTLWDADNIGHLAEQLASERFLTLGPQEAYMAETM